ncbi:MAG TPA: DASH family cryptochrome, partial [Phaeodactylibacter sp.]|nr:DASH family cryptochrome [Phaeodactylibacter sp.]
MLKKRVILWFRQDLRLHDNEALHHALQSGEEVYPVYVFDERVFEEYTKFGFRKTGVHRARFIIEAVEDLRCSLRALGSDLYIYTGKPEEVIFQLAHKLKSTWVFCNRERTRREVQVQDRLERKLWSIGQEIIFSRGKMLYYTQDLPFPITHCPDHFNGFRKEVEKIVSVREPLESPGSFRSTTMQIPAQQIPTLSSLGYSEQEIQLAQKAKTIFKGGESHALQRLRYYFWDEEHICHLKNTMNNLLGNDYSSKFSPWLAQGCLSPKMIYHELKKYEAQKEKSDSTYQMFLGLLQRDFLRLIAKKHGGKFFRKGGLLNKKPQNSNDRQSLNRWIQGRTGIPFIDANMRQLAATGYMSFRGRQNVSSFFIHELQMNWQIGAS